MQAQPALQADDFFPWHLTEASGPRSWHTEGEKDFSGGHVNISFYLKIAKTTVSWGCRLQLEASWEWSEVKGAGGELLYRNFCKTSLSYSPILDHSMPAPVSRKLSPRIRGQGRIWAFVNARWTKRKLST